MFDQTLDLSPYLKDAETPAIYELHSILLHRGTPYTGHYFAYIKSKKNWLCFNDEVVEPASDKQVYTNSWGGYTQYYEINSDAILSKVKSRNDTNAYMLVYIRKDMMDQILSPISESEIPGYLKERIIKEKKEKAQEEAERKRATENFDMAIVTNEMIV